MKKIIFYSYPKSSACRKTSKWPNLINIFYQLIDILKELPLNIFVKLVLKKFPLDLKKISNKRCKIFQSLDLNIFDLTKKKIIEVFSNDGRLIKRLSLVIKEINLRLGFNDSKYVANFK